MLKKLLAPVLIATALVTPNTAQAQLNLNLPANYTTASSSQDIPMIWTAINLGGKGMTSSYDVKRFIETLHLTDQMMVQMFKAADGDYDKYYEIKEKWLAPRMKAGVQQMAYILMLQKYATRSLFKNDWKAFKTTERTYYDQVHDMEDKNLRTLLDEGKGIVYARKKFGEELITAGYPHKSGQTGEELYWEWYELQKKRIKENLRLKEVQKFEYLSALGYAKEFYIRPVEIFDFSKAVIATIEDKIQNKRISQAQASQMVIEDPRISVILKGVNFLGPETTKLSTLREEAPEVYHDFIANIESNVLSFIDDEFATKMKRYEAIAKQMALKYESVEELNKLSSQMKKDFLNSKDYNRLMMAKIYDLAATAIDLDVYSAQSNQKRAMEQLGEQYIAALSKHALAFFSNDNNFLSDSERTRLEDDFSARMNEDFHANHIAGVDTTEIKNSPYLNEIRNLAHWVLKFQVKKASLNTTPKAVVELYNVKTFEGQDRIEKFLKNKQYHDKLEDFKLHKFKPYWNGLITINPTGIDYLQDSQAVDFVLGLELEQDENNNQSFDLFGQD